MSRILTLGLALTLFAPVGRQQPPKPTDDSIIAALRANDSAKVLNLIKAGANPNVRVPGKGDTPLSRFVALGDVEAVRELLDKGADINGPANRDDRPIMMAIRRAKRPVLDLLLSRKPKVDAVNKDGQTAAMVAANMGEADILARLLKIDSDRNKMDREGRWIVHHAVSGGSVECIRLSLPGQPDCKTVDRQSRTPLMYLRAAEPDRVLDLLIEEHAEINARDKYGCTALMRAAQRGDLALVKALMARGADVTYMDNRGNTALTRAIAADNTAIAAAIRLSADVRESRKPQQDFIREVVQVSAQQMESSCLKFRKLVNGTCFSCHNQSQVQYALRFVKDRGITVDAKNITEDTDFVAGEFAKCSSEVLKALNEKKPSAKEAVNRIFPGGVGHIGYGLLGLDASNRNPNSHMEAVARYIPYYQQKDGRWQANCSSRAPSENSSFTETALALFSLTRFVTPAHAAEVKSSIDSGRAWLASTPVKTTEDRTFRLLGLNWAGAPKDSAEIREAVQSLLTDQREDGGWAQESGMTSDAYATGEVLVALNMAGGLAVTDPVYRRGVAFLLRKVEEDGTWFVRSRAVPFQGYIEAGYPGFEDQFISVTAATWATAALALTLPVK